MVDRCYLDLKLSLDHDSGSPEGWKRRLGPVLALSLFARACDISRELNYTVRSLSSPHHGDGVAVGADASTLETRVRRAVGGARGWWWVRTTVVVRRPSRQVDR